MPKISVISGAFMLESVKGVEKSVESVLSQTLRDFEFIICDDGSTDGSYELLSRLARRDGRIKILRNETNLGLAASLNRCIEASHGEYIARHDLDDVSAPERFEKEIAFLESHPEISLVGTAAYIFDERGAFALEKFPERVKNEDFLFTSPYKHGSVIFRRSSLVEVGGYLVSRETRRCEDYELFMRMQRSFSGANLDEGLYYFREDKNALARRKYKYRLDEVKIRWRGFKSLGLLPRGLPYVIKPLAVGLIPSPLLKRLRFRKRKNGKDTDDNRADI